jgi:hypothetical protein
MHTALKQEGSGLNAKERYVPLNSSAGPPSVYNKVHISLKPCGQHKVPPDRKDVRPMPAVNGQQLGLLFLHNG